MKQPTNSNILTPKPPKCGFVVGKSWDDPDMYACVPTGNRLVVIYQGQQLKVCNSGESARKFINNHKKRRKK